ncbi:Allantoate amidohydrolase [Peribacillus sp. Bi96]|uniref:allantoate deiminase n=1 Tax=Peribacillus sp. Bi96 TaxID=2884273 RepID=UPI001D618580|nr:allantoate deiminase [Peribacillus sp. Bi96]CAH0190899.1 Allantoate amidohydrolase [Peribacillus sp. Bi96]
MGIQIEKFNEKDDVALMIEWLASFGATESNGVTRLLYSKEWLRAQQAMKAEMEKENLDTYFDSVGNLFGRLEGTGSSGGTILTGSHIDTVRNGGKYDGAYGVIASFLAVKRLYKAYGPPRKTIEVVSFCEEEGSRFPLTFWGSRNIQGIYDLDHVRDLKDTEGISFLEAMKKSGFEPEAYIRPVRDDIDRFVEIHIEQGAVLEKNQNTIGVVSHIVGQRRFTVKIVGESDHAGTTPMSYRKDAVSAASEFISFLTKKAKRMDPDLVATVGRMDVKPNVPNVIAGEVEFSLDIRHHEEVILDKFCQEIFSTFDSLAKEAEMQMEILQWMDVKPVALDMEMNRLVQKIAEDKNTPYQDMVSGAGHDAQVFGSFCPTCLLFVPSQGGISHSPKEFTSVPDLERGIDVLSEVLYKLAY